MQNTATPLGTKVGGVLDFYGTCLSLREYNTHASSALHYEALLTTSTAHTLRLALTTLRERIFIAQRR